MARPHPDKRSYHERDEQSQQDTRAPDTATTLAHYPQCHSHAQSFPRRRQSIPCTNAPAAVP
eukprot:3222731-Pyramimonas_sp.AAC.1